MPRTKCSSKVTTGSGSSKKKKLKWIPMQMYRVPLSPEQAVLSCCAGVGKPVASVVGTQCWQDGMVCVSHNWLEIGS